MIKKFFKKLFEELADIQFAASSLSYSTLISLIPFLFIILAVFQSIGGMESVYTKIEAFLIGYLKNATGTTVSQYIKNSVLSIRLKAIGVMGVLFLLWTSTSLIRDVDFAFHKIWKIKQSKPLYKRIWLYWIILVAIPIILAMIIGVKTVYSLNGVAKIVEHDFLIPIWSTIFFWILYQVIPDRKVNLMCSFIPAALVSLTLAGLQSSFLWFALKVFRYNKIYGSLASLPIFLIWLLAVWFVILSGVSLSSFLQQRVSKRS